MLVFDAHLLHNERKFGLTFILRVNVHKRTLTIEVVNSDKQVTCLQYGLVPHTKSEQTLQLYMTELECFRRTGRCLSPCLTRPLGRFSSRD